MAACHPAEPARPAAPKGPTACARASDNMVQRMLDRLSAKDAPPTEEADALRNLIRERCEQDGWSAEAIQCLYAMKRLEDAEPCARLMTDEQQAALVRDQQAQLGAAGSPGRSAGGAANGAATGTTNEPASGTTGESPAGSAGGAAAGPGGSAGAPPATPEPRP
ncbi:MAG TPA: hypothetical protein VFK02_23850 [Kofleriaceae bacterium]|nr:hypothetical protein [Kofleriaceae bacterium]